MDVHPSDEEVAGALVLLHVRGWTRKRIHYSLTDVVKVIAVKSFGDVELSIEFDRTNRQNWNWSVSWRTSLGDTTVVASLWPFLEKVFELQESYER